MRQLIFYIKILVTYLLFVTPSYTEIVDKIIFVGNERISKETIKMFAGVDINDDISDNKLNLILKDLYETGFFKNINVSFKENILNIFVEELPVVQKINYSGVKSNSLLEEINDGKLIKEKFPYSELILKKEKNRVIKRIKELGYYNSNVTASIEILDNNLVVIDFDINLGDKAKIKKISFIGNKIFKDKKLKRLIASTEYKFWKFISGRKYLNPSLAELDIRLLRNFYLNNGYYNVKINSTFAKLINNNEFELIFNIDANNKVFFGDLKLHLPIDFEKEDFYEIENLFKKIKAEPYSINLIEKILDEIDQITSSEQYQFIKATVIEDLTDNQLNLTFKINETKKSYITKINIYGNSITQENVIRNQLEIDEGDPFNEILYKKSINNIKSLNFFKTVNSDVVDGDVLNTKVLDIYIEEKPTGEISAQAGYGTDGGSIGFGIKENNFMGKGVLLDSNFLLSGDSFKGKFSVNNPNFNNTEKSIYVSAEVSEDDNLDNFGYKSNKTGITFGTNFEYLKDFNLGVGSSNFYEVIETNSSASQAQQDQKGNYWDSFVNLDFIYDKRNQKFQTTSGYRSFYSLDLPIVSDNNTFKNYYDYSYYFDLFDKNVSSLSLLLRSANSLTGKNVKLSERINLPSSRLRGFETGRIGPKDGNDFIGGNYGASLNFASTIPQIFEESQNVDFLFFIDAANLWGVDYDSSLDDSGSIRSSTGVALDWFSPVGPLNFSLALPITKKDGDKTETFRFNLGTTF